jgi:hypothetical protein
MKTSGKKEHYTVISNIKKNSTPGVRRKKINDYTLLKKTDFSYLEKN